MAYTEKKEIKNGQENDLLAIYESIEYLEEEAKKIGHNQLSILLKNILSHANGMPYNNMEDTSNLNKYELEDFNHLIYLLDRIDFCKQNKIRKLLNVIEVYHSAKE